MCSNAKIQIYFFCMPYTFYLLGFDRTSPQNMNRKIQTQMETAKDKGLYGTRWEKPKNTLDDILCSQNDMG